MVNMSNNLKSLAALESYVIIQTNIMQKYTKYNIVPNLVAEKTFEDTLGNLKQKEVREALFRGSRYFLYQLPVAYSLHDDVETGLVGYGQKLNSKQQDICNQLNSNLSYSQQLDYIRSIQKFPLRKLLIYAYDSDEFHSILNCKLKPQQSYLLAGLNEAQRVVNEYLNDEDIANINESLKTNQIRYNVINNSRRYGFNRLHKELLSFPHFHPEILQTNFAKRIYEAIVTHDKHRLLDLEDLPSPKNSSNSKHKIQK